MADKGSGSGPYSTQLAATPHQRVRAITQLGHASFLQDLEAEQ